MTLRLFSIEHAPPSLPIWHTILEDLGNPPVRRVARVLGLHPRTIYRYQRSGSAPRVVLLALFWLTRWGRSAVHVQATNDALMACALVRGLESRIAELSAQIGHLQRLGGYGSANAPLLDTPRPLHDGVLGDATWGRGGKAPSLDQSGDSRRSDQPPEGVKAQGHAETLGPGSIDTPTPNTTAGARLDSAADAACRAAAEAGRGPTGAAGRGAEGPPA